MIKTRKTMILDHPLFYLEIKPVTLNLGYWRRECWGKPSDFRKRKQTEK